LDKSGQAIETTSFPAPEGPARRTRHVFGATRWTPVLLVALTAAALIFVLLFRLPEPGLVAKAAELTADSAHLRWSATQGPGAMAAARRQTDQTLAQLRDAAADEGVSLPALEAFVQRWQTLPATPSDAVLRGLADEAAQLTQAMNEAMQFRQQAIGLGLKGMTLLLVLVLLVPIRGLGRDRRNVRHSLQEFSTHLGSGDWQGAVQTLREDRNGPASTFGALASGVEGVLGESERRWRARAELSADWYWETDEQHRLSWLAGSVLPITSLGWALGDLMHRRRDQLAFLEPPAEGWEHFHKRLDRHEPFRDLELHAQSKDGRLQRWMAVSGRPRHDAQGRFLGYEGVGRDISERRAGHERLAASEQRWSLMAGLASDWYWETDPEHRVLPLAPEFRRRFPATVEHLQGRTRWEAHRDALSAEEWAEHRADLDARRPFRGLQFQAEMGDGRLLWLSISGIPRFDGQGRFLGYHGVGRDITVRKQAERLLMRHNEELQHAVAARTRDLEQLNLDLEAFSRQLAHELRTPISHVQGLAHLLESRAASRLNDEERQLLELQVGAARHMRETVDALLQLARSTVQPMPMEAVDVSALAAQVITELPAFERAAAVEWQIEPGIVATASPAALRIVLTNLLGNAAKFTRQVAAPRVTLTTQVDADGRLRIAVQDNGAGFAAEQASRLFTPFTRLHASDAFHGTGIGLSIVQRVVERHGGSVAAHGQAGLGARFEFTLAAVPRVVRAEAAVPTIAA
jgi:PAS domain S-box-containing protein